MNDGEVIGNSVGKGVTDLLALVDGKGPALADKLVGKAIRELTKTLNCCKI